MDILAIIPARGGSKGIPYKNICLLAGKPLIAHTIEQAGLSRLINRIVVSTDDEKIASVAAGLNIETIKRPKRISGDKASSESALIHTLEHLESTENYHPELIVFLQCTSPLTSHEDIDGTIQHLISEEADSAFSAIPFHYYVWEKTPDNNCIGVNHNKNKRLMRQERKDQFLENGAVYVMRTSGFLKARHRFFGRTVLFETPAERCFEIDEPIDLKIAEKMITIINR